MEGLVTDPPDVMVMTATATQLVFYQEKLSGFGLGFGYSANIDYYELGNIAFITSTENLPVFRHLSTFQIDIWIAILISNIVLTLSLCLIDKCFTNFWEYFFWFNILFTIKSMPSSFLSDKWSRTISVTSALIENMVLVIFFSALILDSLVRATPIIKIDSWDDLYQRPEVKIIAAVDSPLNQFAQSGSYKPEMAKSFRERIFEFEWENFYDQSQSIYKMLKSGEYAFVKKKIALNYELKRFSIEYDDQELLNDLHVSEDGGGAIPVFIPVDKDMDQALLKRLNEV